jgi:tRNA pseudouridine65 synthase
VRERLLLFRDESIVVVDKPAGMPTHSALPLCRAPALTPPSTALRAVRAALGTWVYPAHRLDAATSGALAFGLTPAAGRELAQLFARREVKKTYAAIVRGFMPAEGVIDRPLVNHATGKTQEAVTRFRALAQVELPWPVGPYATARYSLVELTPLTGRTHQLRRHLAGLAHPIVGDTRFGDGAHNRAMATRAGVRRLLLHATALAFPAPFPPLVEAPCSGAMARAAALFSLPPGEPAGKLILRAPLSAREEEPPCTMPSSSSSPGP